MLLVGSCALVAPALPQSLVPSDSIAEREMHSKRAALSASIRNFLTEVDKTISEMKAASSNYPGDEDAQALLKETELKREALVKMLATVEQSNPTRPMAK